MKHLLPILGLFLSLGLTAAGQWPRDLEGPPIIPVPAHACYVIKRLPDATKISVSGAQINIESKEDTEEKTREPEGIVEWHVRKADKVTLIECITRSGHRGEIWCIDDRHINRIPGRSEYRVDTTLADNSPMNLDFGRTGYPWTDWVAIDNFTGRYNYRGKRTLGFQSRVSDGAEMLPVAAYIDEKTRAPLVAQYGESYYEFTYFPAPKSPLNIPAPVMEAKSNFDRATERLNQMPSRPY